MKAELKEVLKLIDRLNPHDLAIVQEKIAPSPKQSAVLQDNSATIPKNDVFTLPFEKYLALADEERKKVQWRAYQVHQPWIDAELDRRAANWLLVCHGKIIESSSSWQDYPSREKLMALGKKFGFVPFVFVREPMIEESMWHSLPGSDFYPTLKITIGAEGSRAENLPLSGLVFIADFDTGSPNLFLNYDLILANNIIDYQPIDQAHFRPHLGKIYCFNVLPVTVGVTDEQGNIMIRGVHALCVHNWQTSPLCQVNPTREALAGRNLLWEFPLRVELNGKQRLTTVLTENV